MQIHSSAQSFSLFRSHTVKVCALWTLFILAVFGTYILSHNIQIPGGNAAAAFFANNRSHEIDLSQGKTDPASLEINAGDQVVFVVKDDSMHDIAEDRSDRLDARLESGEIGKDESYSLVFQSAGTFTFYDRMDQDVTVTVTVR